MRLFSIGLMTLLATPCLAEDGLVRLFPGYVTRIQCQGRLWVSAIGNDALVRLEALPKELGCGVLLKPIGAAGRTNLILETSTGTIERVVLVEASKATPAEKDLHFSLKGEAQ